MSPAADIDTRSHTGGTNDDKPADTAVEKCTTRFDSSPCANGTSLRRFKKEDGVIYHIPSSSDLASLFALDASKPILVIPPTLKRKSSSSSIAMIRPLRAVRRLLRRSETVAPPKTTFAHAVKSFTSVSTKLPPKRLGSRILQRSASLRVQDGAKTDIATITSRIFQHFTIPQVPCDIHDVEGSEPISQTTVDDTPGKYALENLDLMVRCYERHVTTWDSPDYGFFIFPAQLVIACTFTNDLDPLAIPDVTIVDLVCTTFAINGPYKSHPQIAFRTFYDGARMRYVNDTPTPDLSRGIHIGNIPWCSSMDKDGNFGWYMHFWIPIPFILFQRAETRVFKIDAKVRVNGEDGKDGVLNATSDFTLSRLRSGLVM
ncbi:uncharacterized protein EDB93DRAFT_1104851 [Suillus bovinus]|uniref:uncharacterized protein n=1 Tax=Suillus bovinus TaxID=48563 RepID=UPI001B86823E|nr:uncharacterized protein EDB93DRAFT_1104851 [Suillus bovinus]KAG2144633.1 hypothetical protein EDB93DRAFT_1104851 [Suillus bovinus]